MPQQFPSSKNGVQFKPHVMSSVLHELPPVPQTPKLSPARAPTRFEFDNMTIRFQDGGLIRNPIVDPLQTVVDAVKAMCVAAVVLLVLNSYGLNTWVNNLPTSRTTSIITEAAQTWHGWMTDLGVADAMDDVRNWASEIRQTSWPEASELGVEAQVPERIPGSAKPGTGEPGTTKPSNQRSPRAGVGTETAQLD